MKKTLSLLLVVTMLISGMSAFAQMVGTFEVSAVKGAESSIGLTNEDWYEYSFSRAMLTVLLAIDMPEELREKSIDWNNSYVGLCDDGVLNVGLGCEDGDVICLLYDGSEEVTYAIGPGLAITMEIVMREACSRYEKNSQAEIIDFLKSLAESVS